MLCAVKGSKTFFPRILYHNQDFYSHVSSSDLNIGEFCLGLFSLQWESQDF